MGKQNRKLDVDASAPAPAPLPATSSVGLTKPVPSAPVPVAERIIAELAKSAPLRTGPQEDIPAPLPPVAPQRTYLYIPDERMFESLYL